MNFTVAIIGGGISGSTIAIKLSQIGVKSILFEKSNSLVNGPPMCHLHAGGALYREISTEECIKLLKQSINTLKCFKFSQNIRPTLLTVPTRDSGSPQTIIQRMKIIANQYQKLVEYDKSNQVLGKPSDYYKCITKEQVYQLRSMQLPKHPITPQQWLIPPCKYLNLQLFKFPFILVNEPGLSNMRVSSYIKLCLSSNQYCQILTNTQVINIKKLQTKKWLLTYINNQNHHEKQVQCDFIVNACGYLSGIIDNIAGFKRNRLIQLKASYLAKWNECQGIWPEIVIHGTRNTSKGMVQLTPYVNGYFQIHSMTNNITLFKDGIASSNDNSQPNFKEEYENMLKYGWKTQEAIERTKRAIDCVSEFIPSFRSATETSNPLWGVQQIPGTNPNLRASQISFQGNAYARAQIVKVSTAVHIAQRLIEKLQNQHKIVINTISKSNHNKIQVQEVVKLAKKIAVQRNYPEELAEFYC